jgi:hypothetical protein
MSTPKNCGIEGKHFIADICRKDILKVTDIMVNR